MLKNKVKRIMLIGCCGSGKSVLSKRLHDISGLALIHLDQDYWKPNWTESEPEEWKRKVKELANGDSWIIDGNYGGTMDIRIDRADCIVYLDIPTWKCVYRIIKRTIIYFGKERPDMPFGCKERFSLSFLHYVAVFNLVRRKKLMAKVNKVRTKKKVFILRNHDEITSFLAKI